MFCIRPRCSHGTLIALSKLTSSDSLPHDLVRGAFTLKQFGLPLSGLSIPIFGSTRMIFFYVSCPVYYV